MLATVIALDCAALAAGVAQIAYARQCRTGFEAPICGALLILGAAFLALSKIS